MALTSGYSYKTVFIKLVICATCGGLIKTRSYQMMEKSLFLLKHHSIRTACFSQSHIRFVIGSPHTISFQSSLTKVRNKNSWYWNTGTTFDAETNNQMLWVYVQATGYTPVQLCCDLHRQSTNGDRRNRRSWSSDMPRLPLDRMYFTNPDSAYFIYMKSERVFHLLWTSACPWLPNLGGVSSVSADSQYPCITASAQIPYWDFKYKCYTDLVQCVSKLVFSNRVHELFPFWSVFPL